MDIPKRVMIGPPFKLTPDMREAFRRIGFGCLPVLANEECALFVHVDRGTIDACRGAAHLVRLDLYDVEGVALVRIYVKVYAIRDEPLEMDCFLNVQEEGSRLCLEALGGQERVAFFWFDERLDYVRASAVGWHEEQRRAAREVYRKAMELPGGDFDAAKAKFMRNNPI